ncbi:hypothetical protein BGZ76_008507 [Entomortierella beljakovae]|nr:hypothetical protein BGZ76_008507 [Entomortierella beljakovae]
MSRYERVPSEEEPFPHNHPDLTNSLESPINARRGFISSTNKDTSPSSLASSPPHPIPNSSSSSLLSPLSISLSPSPSPKQSARPTISPVTHTPSSTQASPLFQEYYLPINNGISSENDSSPGSSSRRQRAISHHTTHVRILRIAWLVALLVGEYGVYWAMVNHCVWPENSSWDNSSESQKERYRVAIIADPQLTDWMSYHQTGWLLALVETYTDIFMKRSFSRLQSSLRPDAVLFLGDLNDGGRISSGDVFEKNRDRFFERVFQTKSTAWNQKPIVIDEGTPPPYPTGEIHRFGPNPDTIITGHYQQIADVPLDATERKAIRDSGKSARLYVAGNHDVGFGDTLVRPAMTRYKQVFGSVNYKIEVGNHTFVVLDTLSLSSVRPEIREESEHFINDLSNEIPTLPRILFTHVPLFRLDTTYCGDERASKQLILNRGGEQYYNMVNSTLSRQILHSIQPDMIFSGDDHDWCEVAHSHDSTLTPEVTLRTFSFAQGIKQPSFLMLSLYNPEHQTKNDLPLIPVSSGLPVGTGDGLVSVARPSDNTTFVYEECMLPNQLLIYMYYVALLALSLSWILILRYRWITRGRRHLAEDSLLIQWRSPTSESELLPQGSTTATALSPRPYDDCFIDDISDNQIDTQYPKSKKTTWPLLCRIYWKMVAWDLWNVVRYAVPFYLALFITTFI